MTSMPHLSRAAPTGPSSWRISHGLTLLELLIAVALLSVVGVLSYGGLSEMQRMDRAIADELAGLQEVQRAAAIIRNDLGTARARPVGVGRAAREPALVGEVSAVAFTRDGRSNPGAAPRSDLERVAYRLDSDRLLRVAWPRLDRSLSPHQEPHAQTLLRGVRKLHLRYLDAAQTWSPTWRRGLHELPAAIELRAEVDGIGLFRHVVRLQ